MNTVGGISPPILGSLQTSGEVLSHFEARTARNFNPSGGKPLLS